MSFDWTKFLVLVEALQTFPDSPGLREAALRSAASRAYYAAFHYALDFACREGFVPYQLGEDHAGIQAYFRDCRPANRTRQKIALELSRLYDHRRWADYRDTLAIRPDSLAAQAIGMAKSVLKNLDSLK
jgi:uncharacterized protein (UPF0332 family)